MNRIARYLSTDNKSFLAEVRDVMRCKTGLCKHDVFLITAGWSGERRLWEVRLHLTEGIVFQVGCECEATTLDLWRGLMPQVKEVAQERGLLR